MRNILYKIITLFSRLFYMFKDVRIENSLVYFNRLSFDKNNKIIYENSKSGFSKIKLSGTNNSVKIQGHVSFVDIRVSGDNNQIEIDGDCRILHSRIVVEGCDCIIKIGNGTSVGSMNMICMGSGNSIKIGEKCMLAEDVEIWSSDAHPIFNSNNEVINYSKPILIGNHVWIGKQVAILKGVTIGDNSVIGMRSVVTKNIIPNTLNVGTPAKEIKQLINWSNCFISEYEKK